MRADQWDEIPAAIAQVEENADRAWLEAAEQIIRGLTAGTRFIGEQIVDRVTEKGFVTHDLRAMGPVMQRLRREGVIEHTGEYRPARTSHGSPKPLWRVRYRERTRQP